MADHIAKQWKTIEKQLLVQGWGVSHQDGNHVICFPADKSESPVKGSVKSGDPRGWKNFQSQLRKRGFNPNGPTRKPKAKPVAPATTLGEALAHSGTALPEEASPSQGQGGGRMNFEHDCAEHDCEECGAPQPTFGQVLCKLRTEAGLHQRELAELVGVRQAAISRWERGSSVNDRAYAALIDALPGLTKVERPASIRRKVMRPTNDDATFKPPPRPPMPAPRLVHTTVNKDRGVLVAKRAPAANGKAGAYSTIELCKRLADQLFQTSHDLHIGQGEGDHWYVIIDSGKRNATRPEGRGDTLALATHSLLNELKAEVERRRAALAALIEEVPS